MGKALAHYGESLLHFEKIGDERGLARTYHNIAKTYADAARWQEAGVYYEKSYKLAKEIGDVHTQANIKLNRPVQKLDANVAGSISFSTPCHDALHR